jgi:hypothetical protein
LGEVAEGAEVSLIPVAFRQLWFKGVSTSAQPALYVRHSRFSARYNKMPDTLSLEKQIARLGASRVLTIGE